jgi:outer membrane protein OmpA-like peptidoglycan-associated protein
MSRRTSRASSLNPYIAFTDLCLNLALVFLLFIPLVMLLGNRGWDEARYREYQAKLAAEVAGAFAGKAPADGPLPPERRPRNDAPGEQRWTFAGTTAPGTDLFVAQRQGRRLVETATLTPAGKERLRAFALVLQQHRGLWHRVRIEAHTRQKSARYTGREEMESLRLSADRAAAVAQFLFAECRIPPHRLAISGRGHQDPVDARDKASERNDRVDLLVISPATARR